MVIGWLIASLDRVVAKSVMYNKYGSEIWTDLEERFGVSTFAQIYALHEELSNVSQEANMNITEYFTKASIGSKRTSTYFCDHCKTHGHSMERCFKFHGYPSGYKQRKFVGCAQEINTKTELESLGVTAHQLDNLVALLHKHKEAINTDSISMDLEPIPSAANLAGKFCFLTKSNASKWIINSGATDHMFNSLDSFISVQKILGAKHSVTIPDGRKVMVDLCGDVTFMDGIVLQNVLYVSDFQFNLIFVPKLCQDFCTNVIFNAGECVIQEHSKTKVLAKLSHGLFYADISYSVQHPHSNTCAAATYSKANKSIIDLAKLWHLRLGHLPLTQLKLLIPDIDVNKFHDAVFCTNCPAAKQTRRPFPHSSIKTTRSFQLLHIDIWGRYRHAT